MGNEIKKIAFIYEKSHDYFETFVTSFYGGLSTSGLVKIFLSEDKLPLPEKEIFTIDNNAVTNQEYIYSDDEYRKRVLKGEINMPIDAIPSFITWLQDKYDAYQKLVEEHNKNA